MPAVAGILLVDKPRGVTSHDVVQVVRRRLGIRRIGHTGTLDPIAQGLLVLLVGAATRHQQVLQGHEKTYEAVVRLGVKTDTADADGSVIRTAPVPPLIQDRIVEVLASFRGEQVQTPPTYSAIKVRGRPAYWWARRNRPVSLAPRRIHVAELDLLGWTPETITVHVRCSAGTYVRTLAEGIAEGLGTVGHLTALTRHRVGPWSLEEAKPLSWVTDVNLDTLVRQLLPLTSVTAPAPAPSTS